MGQLKSTLGQKCKAWVNSIQGLNNKFNSIQLGLWEELKTAVQLKSTFFNFIPHTTRKSITKLQNAIFFKIFKFPFIG